jgi:hypothetical protein
MTVTSALDESEWLDSRSGRFNSLYELNRNIVYMNYILDNDKRLMQSCNDETDINKNWGKHKIPNS